MPAATVVMACPLLVVLLAEFGCVQVLSLDRGRIAREQGQGGSTASAGQSVGTSGAGGSGEEPLPGACNGDDTVTACGVDTDCRTFTCSIGVCTEGLAPVGTPCADDNGVSCDGKGTCVEQHCDNGVEDADETGVDCGGAVCNPCASPS
jgi:hypothetical protein